ncbi:F-box protein-like protein isoform X1 [Tanacetum coccineum]
MEKIAGYVSELSLQPVGDDVGKLPLSVHTVVSSDDLLTKILLRLPVISLILFKSVSKRWLSLIKDTNFIKRRGQIPNIDPPFGLFLLGFFNIDLSGLIRYDFVPFDIRILDSVKLDKCIKSYVYNPSVNSSKLLPEPLISELKSSEVILNMKMAFDPTKSPHYKLVHVQSIGEDDDVPIFGYGLYWNDAIHWLTIFVSGALHYKLDFLNKHLIVTNIRLPVTLDEKVFASSWYGLYSFSSVEYLRHEEWVL